MSTRILFPEFRDEFSTTSYPFVDGATRLSNTGIQLPADAFLDASLYPVGIVSKLYLAKIEAQARLIALTIRDARGQDRAYGYFDPLNQPETISLVDPRGRPAGVLVSTVSGLASFGAWPLGEHTFAAAATEFVASCVIPTPEIGVRGLLLADDTVLAGDAWLVGDDGVVLRPDGERTIRVDIVGDPLFRRRLCAPLELFKTPRLLKTINNCPPDAFGGYNITVGDHANPQTVLRLRPDDAGTGLVIELVGKTIRE